MKGIRALSVNLLTFLLLSCSTTHIASSLPPLPATPPEYVKVPHPDGYDLNDLRAIFLHSETPSLESLQDCTQVLSQLKERTQSMDEVERGARELIERNAVHYHWCFYGTLLRLENQLSQDDYYDKKQRHVLDAYRFLTPMARAFLAEFHDSRYLRYALIRYRWISETVFYRRVEIAPSMTAELAGAANPLGLVRPLKEPESGILNKYGLEPNPREASPTPVPLE